MKRISANKSLLISFLIAVIILLISGLYCQNPIYYKRLINKSNFKNYIIGDYASIKDSSFISLYNRNNYSIPYPSLVTFTNSNILINGGNGTFSYYYELNYFTDRQNLKVSTLLEAGNISPASFGFGNSFFDSNGFYTTFAIGMDSGGNNGSMFEFDYSGSVLQYSPSVIPPINSNDTLLIEMELIKTNTIKFSVTNLTQNSYFYLLRNYNFNYPFTYILPDCFKIRFNVFGLVNAKVIDSNIYTNEYKYPDAIFCFDSKAKYFSTSYSDTNTFCGILSSYTNKIIYNSSGVNETISDFHNKMKDLLLYKSRPLNKTKIFIGVGSNNLRFGTFNSFTKNLLISDFLILQQNNFDPYICFCMPEGSLDVTPFNSWVLSEPTFYGKIFTGTFNTLYSGSSYTPNPLYMSPDLIHPNKLGHTQLANSFIPFIY